MLFERMTTAGLLIQDVVDLDFVAAVVLQVLRDADHTVALMRSLAFVYSNFNLFASTSGLRRRLIEETLLDQAVFTKLFLSWSCTLRSYFLHTIVFRVSHITDLPHLPDDPENESARRVVDLLHQRLNRVRTAYRAITMSTAAPPPSPGRSPPEASPPCLFHPIAPTRRMSESDAGWTGLDLMYPVSPLSCVAAPARHARRMSGSDAATARRALNVHTLPTTPVSPTNVTSQPRMTVPFPTCNGAAPVPNRPFADVSRPDEPLESRAQPHSPKRRIFRGLRRWSSWSSLVPNFARQSDPSQAAVTNGKSTNFPTLPLSSSSVQATKPASPAYGLGATHASYLLPEQRSNWRTTHEHGVPPITCAQKDQRSLAALPQVSSDFISRATLVPAPGAGMITVLSGSCGPKKGYGASSCEQSVGPIFPGSRGQAERHSFLPDGDSDFARPLHPYVRWSLCEYERTVKVCSVW